jgi:starvation-inducible DNA-binding protein
VALGGQAEGTLSIVGARSKLAAYPLAIVGGGDHVEAISTALATIGQAVRYAITLATKYGDAGTADLFTEISRDIDKQLWFVESHVHGDH